LSWNLSTVPSLTSEASTLYYSGTMTEINERKGRAFLARSAVHASIFHGPWVRYACIRIREMDYSSARMAIIRALPKHLGMQIIASCYRIVSPQPPRTLFPERGARQMPVLCTRTPSRVAVNTYGRVKNPCQTRPGRGRTYRRRVDARRRQSPLALSPISPGPGTNVRACLSACTTYTTVCWLWPTWKTPTY